MWRLLRARQLAGWKFRRQHPVGRYIADFACVEAGVIVELDGGQHADAASADAARTAALAAAGFRVFRFWNNEVLANRDGVALAIRVALAGGPSPSR